MRHQSGCSERLGEISGHIEVAPVITMGNGHANNYLEKIGRPKNKSHAVLNQPRGSEGLNVGGYSFDTCVARSFL